MLNPPTPITLEQCLNKVEGARVLRVLLDFTATNVQLIELAGYIQNGQLSCIKSLYVDNSDQSDEINIEVLDSQQRITIAPYAQAYIPVLASTLPRLRFTSNAGVTIPVHLINVRIEPSMWSTLGGNTVVIAGIVEVEELATAAVNSSGTITTGGVSQTAIAANAARHEVWVANPSALAESLFINFTGGAAVINGAGSVEIPPSTGWAGQVTNAVTVIAATTGHAYTCGER